MKKIINGIKNIKKTPQNGYLIFSSKELFKIIEPPLPIKQNYYKCDNKFHIDNFSYLFEIHNKYLILMISSKNCYIYLNNGTNLKSLYHHDIDISASL
jgi:peptide subunit release factor 1 (eRF1)